MALLGHHAQDSIPAESLPRSCLDALGGDSRTIVVLLAVCELLLDLNEVVERKALEVLTSFVDVRSVINKELPHNENSMPQDSPDCNP